MPTTILKIKNMVCPRCIKVVKEELEKLGYPATIERLGVAEIEHTDETPDIGTISKMLEEQGFELLVEKQSKTIESIKNLLIDLIYKKKLENINTNLSTYISQTCELDYTHLSNLFSSVEGITIEKYFILQKIERVKELLIYDELTLSQIADQLGYSSVQYLSNQFNDITGMRPTQFKSLRGRSRLPIDKISVS